MKRDQRRSHERYTNRNDASAQLLKLTRPKIAGILRFLEKNLGADEVIEITCWHDEFFYLSVLDLRYKIFPATMLHANAGNRCAITVDVANDRIVWSDLPYPTISEPKLSSGGNCYVRANKWKPLLKHIFPRDFVWFRVYRDVPISKYLDAHLTHIA